MRVRGKHYGGFEMTEPTPELCADLLPILLAELSAGNRVGATGPAMGQPTARQVLLALQFRAPVDSTDERLEHRLVDDPHWWKEELRCRIHGDVLACRFD